MPIIDVHLAEEKARLGDLDACTLGPQRAL